MHLRPLVAALRRPVPSSRVFRSFSTLQVSPLKPTTTAPAAASPASYPETSHQLTVLEQAILQRRPSLALHHLAQLQSPPSYHLLQKLCVLLARQQKNRSHALRAFEILCGVYRTPGFKPDDYTNLASVYVMEACVRFQMLDAAIELYDEAVNQGIMLDLPAYNGLLTALIEAERMEEAMEILKELINGRDVCPTEQIVLPVLVELIKNREYESAMEFMKKGQNRGVEFSSDTFHPLISLTEKDTASTDALVKFLTFIEDVWDEYKAFVDYDSEEEDDVGDS